MKWIEDDDEQRIRHAMVMIEKFSRENGMLPKTLATARNRLNIVLTNIQKLRRNEPRPEVQSAVVKGERVEYTDGAIMGFEFLDLP